MRSIESVVTVVRLAGIGGALAGLLAVVFGAFATHALREALTPDALAIWRTAVDYQFWHALALLATAIVAGQGSATSTVRVAAIAFLIGIVVFCGSLYALALGAPRGVGAFTPFGGIAFLVGWAALAWRFIDRRAR